MSTMSIIEQLLENSNKMSRLINDNWADLEFDPIKSDYNLVKEFTEEAYEIECPETPIPMNKEQVIFLINMMLSEITELAETVSPSMEEALDLVKLCLGTDLHNESSFTEDHQETAANQADALVDSYYYSLNVACKHGMNLSKVFTAVHKANMDKRNPTTGKFIRRESDGKILKIALS